MEVYVLELTSIEDYTHYKDKYIISIFNSHEKAVSCMQKICNKKNIILTKDEYGFYNCDKAIHLDASYFTIESYIIN